MNTDLIELERLAKQRGGVKVWEASPGHIKVQAEGRAVVNYWPGSRNRTAHTEGTPKGFVRCDPIDVIRMALDGPKAAPPSSSNRRPAGEKIAPGMYAAPGEGYAEKLTALPPSDGSAPW